MSEVPREVVLGMDVLERKISFVASGIAFLLAALFIPHLLHNTKVTDTAKVVKGTTCPKDYHYVAKALNCQKVTITHPSAWVVQFLLIIAFGLALVAFSYFRKRSGVAASSIFLGLALGTAGLPFLFLGGWLVVRAFRLQKYGDPTFAGSNRRAREKAKAKREGRSDAPRSTSRASDRVASRRAAKKGPVRPSGPAPSKRYTPKQKPRKR